MSMCGVVWLPIGDGEQFGAGMKKQPIVDQDKYKGEWVALDPKTDAVLSHSRSWGFWHNASKWGNKDCFGS